MARTQRKRIEKNHVHTWSIFTEPDQYHYCSFGEEPPVYAVAYCQCGAHLDGYEIEEMLNSIEQEKVKALQE